MAPAVSLRSAVALLGRFPALAGVDLDVEETSATCIIGPNGAGKSTLLALLAGLLALREGSGTVLGYDLSSQRRALRREVGLLSHHAPLYADLTPSENLDFALRASRLDPSLASGALERAGLPARVASTPVRALSAGQRRRTGLAWLLARRPRLWLLDEPHAGLDPAGRDLCDSIIAEACQSGATVVMTSHDLDRARMVADRLVTINGGVIVENGGRGDVA